MAEEKKYRTRYRLTYVVLLYIYAALNKRSRYRSLLRTNKLLDHSAGLLLQSGEPTLMVNDTL